MKRVRDLKKKKYDWNQKVSLERLDQKREKMQELWNILNGKLVKIK